MICNNCNATNPDGSKFCEKCGSPLQMPPVPQQPKKKKSGAGKIVAIVLGILAGLGLLGFIVILIIVLLGGGVIATIFGFRNTKVPEISVDSSVGQSVVGQIDPEQDLGQTDPEDAVVEVPDETPSSPALSCPYTIMNVTSNLGLNIRSAPTTEGAIIGVLIQNRHVFALRTENGWAYIKSGDLHGWCSMDYLEPVALQASKTYTVADIQKGFDEANKIISSYHGKSVSGARTDINPSNVVAYFDSCNAHYQYNASFGEQFQKLTAFAADSERVYYFVDDPTVKTVDDLCKKYFGMFSDDVADACLRGKVLVIDGRLAIGFESNYYSGLHISHTYEVAQVSPDRIDVTVIAKMYNKQTLVRDGSGKPTATSPSYETRTTYPCIFEDGGWVFDSMEVIYE
ncbi:MAG: SH3 domain-containing protein [Clostridia bacterium]|nr:SH3 domain-containing protein [Clostridia bacterium]